MTDNEEDDTLTFNMKNTFIFRPDLSNGLTGNEIITTVHSLIMVKGGVKFHFDINTFLAK